MGFIEAFATFEANAGINLKKGGVVASSNYLLYLLLC
jgi:hypothetical protein